MLTQLSTNKRKSFIAPGFIILNTYNFIAEPVFFSFYVQRSQTHYLTIIYDKARDKKEQAGTISDKPGKTKRDRDILGQTGTSMGRQGQTRNNRDIQGQTGTDRDI